MTVKFTEFCNSVGCAPADPSKIVADDKIHRLQWAEESNRTESISYRLSVLADGFEFGWVTNWKNGEKHNYSSRPDRVLTPAEKDEHKKRIARARSNASNERFRAAQKAAERAKSLFDVAKTNVNHSCYMQKKGLDSISMPQFLSNKGAILNVVPIYADAGTGSICSLQFIVDYIEGDAEHTFQKRFLRDGAVKGGAYIMPNPNSREDSCVYALVEGLATGFTVLLHTDWNVIVCFSAGNLVEVAKVIKSKNDDNVAWRGDAEWLVCCDNDHKTAGNPGLAAGQKAAGLIGGRVLSPPSDEGVTDFNDYYVRHGSEAVRQILDYGSAVSAPSELSDGGAVSKLASVIKKCRPLGYNHQTYYFLPTTTGQVEGFSAPALGRLQNLATLAPIEDWRSIFSGSTGAMCSQASVKLIEACHSAGTYDPLRDGKVRGPGLWFDKIDGDDVAVLHVGNNSIKKVKGGSAEADIPPHTLNGIYQYELEPPICNFVFGTGRILDFSSRLYDACGFLPWRNQKHGELLAGWIVSAILSGVLPWRPHVHLIGAGGVGKTTVVKDLVMMALGSFGLHLEGGSSEAGIRRKIGQSARPVVIDEFEAETDQGRRQTEEILKLMRGASSGSQIQHADGAYTIRSCFLIAGINSPVKVRADRVRITELELSGVRNAENYNLFRSAVDGLADDAKFDAKLRAAVVQDAHELVASVKTVTKLLANECDDSRLAQQLAPMVVGAEWLKNGIAPNFSEMRDAAAWASAIDAPPIEDGMVCLQTILAHRVNMYGTETTLGQVLDDYANANKPTDCAKEARLAGSYGLQVKEGWLHVANNSVELSRVLSSTPWGSNWGRVLREIDGSEASDSVIYFSSGLRSRSTKIPMTIAFGDDNESS